MTEMDAMRVVRVRPASWVTMLSAFLAAPAAAQTQLPSVVITVPSPVAAPPRPAPLAANAPSLQVPPPVIDPPPGSILITDDTFAAVTVVTSKDLESRPGATITDTLMNMPGISGSTFAAGASRPIIRGLDNARVRVQENGIGAHDVSTISEDHALPIAPFAVDRMEVVRGPATLRYGSQAIGGVVAVENGRIPSAIPRNGVNAEITGGFGSVDDGRDGGFKVTAGSGNIVLHADAFNRSTSDYRIPGGRQANSFVNSAGHALGGSFVWSGGFAGVSYISSSSLYGIPGGEAALIERSRIDMNQQKLLAKGEWRIGGFGIQAIHFWAGGSSYVHDELVSDGHTTLTGTRFANVEQEARVEVQHVPASTALGRLTGAIGIQMGRKRIAGVSVDEPSDGLLDPARAGSAAAFVFEELEVTPTLRLQASTRLQTDTLAGRGCDDISDRLNVRTFEGERTFRPFSAGLGLLYQLPSNITARTNAQMVERAPDTQELFSKGVHEATGTFEIGDPQLAKEKARTVEVGLRRSQGDLRFDASVFATRFDGFIFKRMTGAGCGDTLASCGIDDELKQIRFSQRDAFFRGVEVQTEYDVARLWRGVWGIEGQYDFVRATFSEGENVPRIPPHRLGGGLYYRDINWNFRIGLLHAFRQTDAAPQETATSGYALLNAELSYAAKLSGPQALVPEIRIGVRGDNLLDDDVRNHVSFKKDEVLQPGASVRLFGSIKLN